MQRDHGAVIRTWSDEVFNWKGAIAFALLSMLVLPLRGMVRGTFGLSGAALFFELGMAMLVFTAFGTTCAALSVGLAGLLGLRAPRTWLVAAIIFAPLTFFLVGAHLAMSQALAPLKREFAARAVKTSGDETDLDPSLDAILVKRDAMLRQYGYLHLGGWRAAEGRADCSSVYFYMGTF